VEATPDRPFLGFEGRSWTYAEVDAQVRAVAAGLGALGVGPGTHVLVGMTNRPETIQVHLALQALGAVCVPLLPGLAPGELAYQARHSRGEVLVADEPVASALAPELGGCRDVRRVVPVGPTAAGDEATVPVVPYEEVAAARPLAADRFSPRSERDPYAVFYTSGSSGPPKGVVLGVGSFETVGEAFAEKFGVTGDDAYALPLPLAHATGAVAMSMTLQTGGRLALLDRFSPSTFWRSIEDHGATVTTLFPAHLNLLLETAAAGPAPGETTLRLVITHSHLDVFCDRFGVELATVWGMTETGAHCTGTRPGEHRALGLPPGCIGTPMIGVEAGIFDAGGRRLPAGAVGELRLRHRNIMLGYLNDPGATAATVVDGWVRSGDAGLMSEDGRLHFRGRLKNVIKRSGENIGAEEVEAVLGEDPAVAEALVFGVPDPIRTEEVGAVVVRRPGAELAPEALRERAEERLARWKVPRYVWLVDEPLPRLGNGKIDRMTAIAAAALEDAHDAARARGAAGDPGRRGRR
jgi:crotonobetaine/carnitine-CoA ligase